jgi:hypothetical protein
MNAQSHGGMKTVAKRVSGREMNQELQELHRSLNLYGRQKSLSVADTRNLKSLLELHAFREEWDRVVDLASQGIVLGVSRADEIWLYRAWLEGLKEDLDVEGLSSLGQHLIARRDERIDYLALAVHAFVYAGKPSIVKSALQQLYRMEADSSVVRDAFAVARLESVSRDERMMGLRGLASGLKKPCCGYFSYHSFLSYAFENDALATVASALKSINGKYPRCPEPHFVAALLAINEGKWQEGIACLDSILAQNSTHADALILKARCLDMVGKTEEGRQLLMQNASLFPKGDYELNVQLGLMERDLFQKATHDAMMHAAAVSHLSTAQKAAQAYGFSESAIVSALEELGARKSEMTPRGEQHYWLLTIEPKLLVQVLESEKFHLHCPSAVKKDDIIFFSAEGRQIDRSMRSVSGFMRANSSSKTDEELGATVQVCTPVVFEKDVEFKAQAGLYPMVDAFGQENCSKTGLMRYFEIEQNLVDDIVSQVESAHLQLRRVG